MKYDDNNPLHRKQMEDYLTKGPTRTSLAMQKDLQKNPKLTVDELVKRQKPKLTENMIPAANKKPGSSMDDIYRNLLIEEMKVRDLDEAEIKYMMDTKPRNQLRTQKLSNTAQRILAKQTKPNTQVPLKNKKIKPFSKVIPKPLNINISPITFTPTPPADDARLKQLEEKFNKILLEDENNKTRGLANLTGLIKGEKI